MMLARKNISEEYNVPFDSIKILKGMDGNPYFSRSHSGNWIVFVMDSQQLM